MRQSFQERVNVLEDAIKRVLYIRQQTQIELQEFKQEMKEFKDEIRNDTKALKEEMKAFKDEMKVFKDEMTEYKEWSKKNIESLNKKWGKLANKMGTLVEDVFLPSIDLAIEKYFKAVPDMIQPRLKIRRQGEEFELDILAISNETKQAFVVEVKASPHKVEHVERFEEKLKKVKEYPPNLKEYELVGIFAALNMDDGTINLLTKKGLYAMVMKGDMLEIVNFDKIKSKRR